MAISSNDLAYFPVFQRITGYYDSTDTAPWTEGQHNPTPEDRLYSGGLGLVLCEVDLSSDLDSSGSGTYCEEHFAELGGGTGSTEKLVNYSKFNMVNTSHLYGLFAARFTVAIHDTDPTYTGAAGEGSEHFFALGTSTNRDYAVKPGANATTPPVGYKRFGLQTDELGVQVSKVECFPRAVDTDLEDDIHIDDLVGSDPTLASYAGRNLENIHPFVFEDDTDLYQTAKILKFRISDDSGNAVGAGTGHPDDPAGNLTKVVRIIGDGNSGTQLNIVDIYLDDDDSDGFGYGNEYCDIDTYRDLMVVDESNNPVTFNKIYGWRILGFTNTSLGTSNCALAKGERTVTCSGGGAPDLWTNLAPGDAIYDDSDNLIGIVDQVISSTQFNLRHPHSLVTDLSGETFYARRFAANQTLSVTANLLYNTDTEAGCSDSGWAKWHPDDVPADVAVSMTFFSEYVLNGGSGVFDVLLVPENETTPIYPVNPGNASEYPDNRIEHEGGYPHNVYDIGISDYPPIYEHTITGTGGYTHVAADKEITFNLSTSDTNHIHIGLEIGDHLYNGTSSGETDPTGLDDMGYIRAMTIDEVLHTVTIVYTGAAPTLNTLYVSRNQRSYVPVWVCRLFRTDVTSGPTSTTGLQRRGTSITKG